MASVQPLTFSLLLKRLRRAAGLTQEELAERAGLSVEGISALERGVNRTPRRDTVDLLAQALHLNSHDRILFESAARGRPVQSAPLSHARAAALGTPLLTPPLVGRARELAALERHLAATSTTGALLVAGEPGIGKTRLLQEAAQVAAGDGWRVLAGGCTRRSGQEPFSPLLETIASFLRTHTPAQLHEDLEGCAWLVRLLPELAEQAVVPVPAWTLPPDQERRLMFAAVARFLANAAGPAGIVLVLDDLQWASADALQLLAALLQSPSPRHADGSQSPPLRLLGAYRSTEVNARDPLGLWLSEHAALGLTAHLSLGPLPPAAAVELLDVLLVPQDQGQDQDEDEDGASSSRAGGSPSSASAMGDLRARVLERADGVPFFLVSCAQGLKSGTLPAGTGNAVPRSGLGVDAVPWDVAQSIRLRLAALPDPARLLLGIASVAGRVVLRHELFAVARQSGRELPDDDAILAALEAATHAGLLVETSDEAYAFAHDLIRDVILTDLSAARHEAWHRRVGEALEQLPAEARHHRVAELAWHFVRGADGARALPYTLEAGDQAAELYAHDEAEQHFQGALALARELGAPRQEAEALEKRGTILRLIERNEEAADVFTQAAEAYRRIGDIEGVWRASGQLAGVCGILGLPERGRALLQPLIEAAAHSGPTRALATMYLEYSWLSWLSDDLNDRLRVAEETVRVAAAVGESRTQGEAEFQCGNTLVLLGRIGEALQSLERAVLLLEETGHLRRLCSALNVIAGIYKLRGEFEAARTSTDRALRIALQVGVRSQLRYTWVNHAEIAFLRGDWKSAETDYKQALHLSNQDGDRLEASQVFGGLGLLRVCKGDFDEGVALLEQAISHAAMQGAMDNEQLLGAHAALAEFELVSGRPHAAHDRLTSLLSPGSQEVVALTQCQPLLAWAALRIGESSRAEVLLAETVTQAIAQPNHLSLVDALRVRALVALKCGAWQEAEGALERAVAMARAMPYPYGEAKVLYAYGRLHAAKGETEPARERYEAAIAICDRLGEGLYRPHIEQALHDLGRASSATGGNVCASPSD